MMPAPLALIAELTYRCPLRCVYCSNPVQMHGSKSELATEDWLRVFKDAGQMGLLHLHLTGGEPLGRVDLTELIAGAHSAGLYTNLITSGVGLSEVRLQTLIEAGLDHIQLSFQDSTDSRAQWISGVPVHAHKVKLAHIIRKHPIALTINLVVHRQNLDHLEEMIAFVEELAPDRMEIAHAQYYGWALLNRAALLPSKEQLDNSLATIGAARQRLQGRIRIDYVIPDYYARFPKACMGGWARSLVLIDPSGNALPCHAAGIIPGLQFDNVRDHSLDWIWRESAAFRKFRGETWMPDPCRGCERRTQDFGGCRCQAFLLTGNAAATDPVCSLAPGRNLVDAILLRQNATDGPLRNPADTSLRTPEQRTNDPWSYRVNPR
jgi:pyrroloquinoline quinone biosynthesis protein E